MFQEFCSCPRLLLHFELWRFMWEFIVTAQILFFRGLVANTRMYTTYSHSHCPHFCHSKGRHSSSSPLFDITWWCYLLEGDLRSRAIKIKQVLGWLNLHFEAHWISTHASEHGINRSNILTTFLDMVSIKTPSPEFLTLLLTVEIRLWQGLEECFLCGLQNIVINVIYQLNCINIPVASMKHTLDVLVRACPWRIHGVVKSCSDWVPLCLVDLSSRVNTQEMGKDVVQCWISSPSLLPALLNWSCCDVWLYHQTH